MKFSVIVPVYNVEKYLDKCLTSLLNQTFRDFEVIVVNDGTKDQSQKIIDFFCETHDFIHGYIKENGGLSDARNYGVLQAVGDYLIFVDSDDWVEPDLLEKLNEVINLDQGVQLIKFNYYEVNENTGEKEVKPIVPYHGVQGEKLYFNYASAHVLFEMAWLYCYQSKYWHTQGFTFAKGYIHEDFELTPRAIMLANKVTSIDYAGYNYLVREGTITRNGSEDKALKSVYDVLHHFDTLLAFSQQIVDAQCKQYFQSYIANAVMDAMKKLNSENKKCFEQEIIKRQLSQYLLGDTFPRKLKKIFYQLKYK